jgi:hypothetical protein
MPDIGVDPRLSRCVENEPRRPVYGRLPLPVARPGVWPTRHRLKRDVRVANYPESLRYQSDTSRHDTYSIPTADDGDSSHPSWFGVSGPSLPARVATGGSNSPGRDGLDRTSALTAAGTIPSAFRGWQQTGPATAMGWDIVIVMDNSSLGRCCRAIRW